MKRSPFRQLILLAAVAVLSVGCEHVDADNGDELDCNTPFVASDYPAATVSFNNDIKPILAANACSSIFCHGGEKPPSNFSVKTATDILGPGNEALQLEECNVTRGKPEESYLIKKLEGAAGIIGERMPFGGGPIDPTQLETIRQWIIEGARDN
ncbi:MAG: hypothetical protein R2834_23965 [Rhodothermales bacterium]